MRLALACLLCLLTIVQLAPAQEPVRERIEWADIWVTNADKDDLPRVLMIGDSITKGYFSAVEKRLAGKAYCAQLATSKCVADPSFLDEVQLLLKQYKFAAIHFNNGLHGWGYTEDQYRDGLLRLVTAFQEHGGNAKLIWATTTPVSNRGDVQQISERTERVKARNRIAAAIIKDRGIATDDLFRLVEQHADWHTGDGVHFNGKGKEAQAAAVAESVLKCL